MASINDILSAQIHANAEGLNWGKTFLKGEQLATTRERLIRNRIELKRIEYAEGMNPAAAIFGESQVGKSYLVDNLLASRTGGPLEIYDGYGQTRSFIQEINPIGGGKESTSLVSRFTTKKQWKNDDFPIKVLLLKPVDIVLTVCDSFFNDIKTVTYTPTADDVKEFLSGLKQRFGGQQAVQNYITEDEVFEMKEYFGLGVLNRGELFINHLNDAHFFEEVASFISAVDVNHWVDVFGYLWNNNKVLNSVFERLVKSYQKLDFHSTVYIKMDAVLRKTGTILQVDRLFELFGIEKIDNGKEIYTTQKASVPEMEVWIESRTETVMKSEFCALAAEVILKIDDRLEEEKPFLKGLDILDFPGARSREMLDEQTISNDMACNLLIRGKVAYLFNKYSQQYLITNLLFCHHKEKSEVKTISSLLEGWIKGMIGATPEERASFMSKVSVPPLFLIGTKFNMDMVKPINYHPDDEVSRKEEIDGLWDTRFTNLANLIGPQAKWFNEWVPSRSGGYTPFQNVYLLRAFDYSCQTGIYEGYQVKRDGNWELNVDAEGRLVGEQNVSPDYVDHLRYLGKSFGEFPFVKAHFADTRKSWGEVAEVGKDGSQWIIENLTASSEQASDLRDEQFRSKVRTSMKSLCQTLRTYFHDDKADANLREALMNAGQITFATDALFGKDKYFFAEFIDKILLREDEIHDRILDTINSNTMVTGTDLSMLFAIRNRANIDPALELEDNRMRIRTAYNIGSEEQLDKFLANFDFTMEDLINPPKIRNLARIIVDEVEKFWLNEYFVLGNFGDFVDRGMPEEYIDLLIRNMTVLYKDKLKITEKISDHIHPFVASPEKLTDMAEMIADICAEMINRFVNSMGTAYFDESLWNDVRDTVTKNGFDVNVNKIYEEDVEFEEESTRKSLDGVFEVFDNIDTILNQVPVDEEKLTLFSNYHAYKEWTEMMKVSFLATCGIPKYDVNANNALRDILEHSILKNEALAEMIEQDATDQYGMRKLGSSKQTPL